MNKFLEGLTLESNKTKTANGADAYQSTMDSFVDFYGGLTSYRSSLLVNKGSSELDVFEKFGNLMKNDRILALKLAFYARDVRGGQGEKLLGRTLLTYVANNEPEMFEKIVHLIPFYGSWKDVVYILADTTNIDSRSDLLDLISRQLNKDLMADGEISLMAKWLPSTTTKDLTKKKALQIIVKQLFNGNEKKYRQTIVKLRAKLNLFETVMTNKDYEGLKYETIPSQALKRHLQAIFRNDLQNYREFMERANRGEVSVKSTTLAPHELIDTYINNDSMSKQDMLDYVNVAWNNLPRLDKDVNKANILPLIDVSGSMCGTPMEVAVGLGMFVAEQNETAFKDHFITFHERPKLLSISQFDKPTDKINYILKSDWGGNTDFAKVMDLILNNAVSNKLTQEDMPDYLLVLSDMQFDSAFGMYSMFQSPREEVKFQTLHKRYVKRFAEHGYKLPTMIYWNLESHTNAFPVTANEEGTILLSGYNPSVLNYLMEGDIQSLKQITPTTMMLKVLNSSRYDLIEEALEK